MRAGTAEFSRAVALIHEAAASPEQWPDALAAVMGLLEGSRISLMDIEAGTDRLLAITHVGHSSDNAKLYAERYFAIDPTRVLSLRAPVLRAESVYENFSASYRSRDEYFEFAQRVCRIGDVIGVSTAEVEGQRSLLSLQRTTDAPGYSADDKGLIELVVPHLQLAKRLQKKLAEALSAKAELEAAFARLATAAFIVDARQHIRHLNPAAAALFSHHRDVCSRHGRLSFSEPASNAAFQTAVRRAAIELGCATAVPLQLGGENAEILVVPLRGTHSLVAQWQEPLALVAVAAGKRDERLVALRMRQLYRLTPAEARIAAALSTGKTVEEIAAANGVGEATLRSHLRSIFGKTGTRRQAELVRLALVGSEFS